MICNDCILIRKNEIKDQYEIIAKFIFHSELVLSGHSKLDKAKVLQPDFSLMQVISVYILQNAPIHLINGLENQF